MQGSSTKFWAPYVSRLCAPKCSDQANSQIILLLNNASRQFWGSFVSVWKYVFLVAYDSCPNTDGVSSDWDNSSSYNGEWLQKKTNPPCKTSVTVWFSCQSLWRRERDFYTILQPALISFNRGKSIDTNVCTDGSAGNPEGDVAIKHVVLWVTREPFFFSISRHISLSPWDCSLGFYCD